MKCMITDQDIDKLVDEEVEDEDGICGGWWIGGATRRMLTT